MVCNSVSTGIMLGLVLSRKNNVSVMVFVLGARSTMMESQPYSLRMSSHTRTFRFDCWGSVSWMIEFDVDMAESVSPADEMNIPVSWNFSGNWLYRHETGIWMMASPSLCNFVEKLKMSLNAGSLYPYLLSVVTFMPQYIVVLFVLLLEESITLFL